MPVKLDVDIPSIDKQLAQILSVAQDIQGKEGQLMAEVDDLNAALGTITTAVQAAIADIQTLSAQIAANKTDATAMEDAAGKLNTLAANLAAAVAPPAP
jgi:septal ring factor EnvC (AmiA/AmiB activator)